MSGVAGVSVVSPWIPVLVTAILGLVGLAIQGALFGHFTGRLKAGQEFTRELVNAMLTKDRQREEAALRAAEEKGALLARIENVERNTAGVSELRETVSRMDERLGSLSRAVEEGAAQTNRHLDSVQRQIGSLVTGAAGAVVEIHKPGAKPRASRRPQD